MGRGRPKGSNIPSAVKTQPQLSVWAQCDNPGCAKWRRLPPGSVVDDSVPWFCFMNPDELRNTCEAPEESYNEDIEGYQMPEDPSIQISSDDEGTTEHGSWRDGAAKRGAKRKHAGSAGGGRGRGRGAGKQVHVKTEPDNWALAPGAKRQRTARGSDGGRGHSLGYPDLQPARLHSEPSQPGLAQKLPRGAAKVMKAHGAFQKLLAGAGSWEAARARTPAVQVPPQHAWEAMAQYAPEAAELACQSLDIASAQSYFAGPGGQTKEVQPGGTQRTARLALMMAAAAAADSAAGIFHTSMPSPGSQALLQAPASLAQPASSLASQQHLAHSSPAPLHGSIGLPPGGPAALLNASAAGVARTAGTALGQPGSAGTARPAGQPALQGPQQSLAAAARGAAAPGTALPLSAAGYTVPQVAPLPGAPGAQPPQHAAAAHSSMQRPSRGGGLAALPVHAAGLSAHPWHGASSSAGHLPSTMQPGAHPSNARAAHAAVVTRPLNSVQPGLAAAAASPASSRGLAPVTGQGASGLPSSASLHSAQPSVPQGDFGLAVGQQPQAHTAEATQAHRYHSSMQGGQHMQQAPPHARETGLSQKQKLSKPGEGLLEVQAGSSGVPQADSRGKLNGHDHKAHSRSHSGLSNGAHEQGAVRGHAAVQHECGKSEHGSEKGRPPEVPAGYS